MTSMKLLRPTARSDKQAQMHVTHEIQQNVLTRVRDRATSHTDPIAHANRAQHPVNTTRTCNKLPDVYM